jgi:hypothetical protein
LQCVVRPLCAHMMMGKATQFLIHERGQLSESSIVPLAPLCQELRHSLLRNRGSFHTRFLQPISPEKSLHAESVSRKMAIQMSTLIARSRLWQRQAKKANKKKSQLHS